MPSNNIECPRAQSSMTPCIARDGHLALADDGKCVGCGHKPVPLIKSLGAVFEPAKGQASSSPKISADRLQTLVKDYVEQL